MTDLRRALALATVAAVLSGGVAYGQDDHHDDHPADHHDDHPHPYVKHSEWHKGATMHHEDWARGVPVDYHRYHLRQPPSGYEWREVDGNYVLAAVATGVIASVVIASSVH